MHRCYIMIYHAYDSWRTIAGTQRDSTIRYLSTELSVFIFAGTVQRAGRIFDQKNVGAILSVPAVLIHGPMDGRCIVSQD